MRLSIVIPVYNEVATLERIVERVLAVPLSLEREVILVDDGSSDGTRDLYPKIEQRWLEANFLIKLAERNRGKGSAIRQGFALATGDIILIQDADLEYDPGDYDQLLEPILDGRADVVYGSRFVGGDAHRVLYFWHMIGNRFLTLLSNMMTNLNLTDMETCYKVFRAEVIKPIKLRSNDFRIEPEMTAKVARGKWRIYEVGISYAGRTYEEGKKIGWKDAVKAVWAILRFRVAD
ncbi:MAG: glycosyltransferase family 2 protein [bacterium]|nr:glycosyltransferase family 2 protein [bacterium]